MKTTVQDRHFIVEIDDFSLADTLDCGQCFRFEPLGGGNFRGFAGNRPLTLRQEGNRITFYNTAPEEFEQHWKYYFDFETDYQTIKRDFLQDDILRKSCDYAGGIRILNQDPWETLCSFIISQNNNIPRIKGIIDRLCSLCGEECACGYAFPTPEALAGCSLDDLSPLRAGFRARYLLDAARKVSTGKIDLPSLYTADLDEARKTLRTICGVGPKVAECVLLFGFHRLEAFPVDVWIKRALTYFYQDGFPEYAQRYGGIAQQYIFHYIRNCPEAIPDEYRRK